MTMIEQFYSATIPPVPSDIVRPLWSVMIPTYNCSLFLPQTINSVLKQSPELRSIQIEVVDDYSTKDNLEDVVKKFGNGQISFYRQLQNVGKAKNFETCLKRSRGELIHILHGDDYVINGFYQKIQQIFEDFPEVGMVFCRSIIMDESGHWQEISALELKEPGLLNNWLEKMVVSNRIKTPSVVVRRSVYEELGGFDERLLFSEDWEMWVRIAANFAVAYEPEPLAVYRFKPLESLSPPFVKVIMQDMCVATNIMESYLSQYLPPDVAYKLLKQTKEILAEWPLRIAKQKLSEKDITTGVMLLRLSLKCSQSLRILKKILNIIIKSQLSRIKTLIQKLSV